MTRTPRSWLPTSLTGRLVMAVVALVAVVGLLVAVGTTLVLRGYLVRQVDEGVAALADGPPRADDATGGQPRVSGAGDPGGEGHARGDDDWTVTAHASATNADVELWRPGRYPVSVEATAQLRQTLLRVPIDGEAHTLDLGKLGTYRVMASGAPGGAVFLVGRRSDAIDGTVLTMFWSQLVLTAVAVAVAGLAGLWVVRRTLRPLREVAQTAHEVTTLPLDTGEVGETARVPERLTDQRTEVGQVGAALNRLLGHVEGALDARHRSELQVRQFVADASHELRTPLATIMGYAELARRSPDYEPGDALVKVEEEGVRMRALVEDLLLLARLDAGRPLAQDQVDLTKLALESVEDARVVGGGHLWLLDLPEEPVTVTGDDQRLHQVLANLLTNARRHTPPGTTVRVGLTNTADRAVLTVADDGPGIPADLLPEVFERFTRADTSRTRDSGGAGLGLALVQAIVVAHGGSVAVESSPGSTVFRVFLARG